MKRWTKQDLNLYDDLLFAQAILAERRDTLTNPYSPLPVKLSEAQQTLETLRDQETQAEEEKRRVQEMTADEAEMYHMKKALDYLKATLAKFDYPGHSGYAAVLELAIDNIEASIDEDDM